MSDHLTAPVQSGASTPALDERYSERIQCKSCGGTGSQGEHCCTDCLGSGIDPGAFIGGIDAALNEAYAEGRKDEREDWARSVHDVLAERQRQVEALGYTPEHDDEEHASFHTYKPSGEYFVPVCEHTIEVDIDDSFDPRPIAAAAIDKKIEETRAELTKTITDLLERKAQLLALENKPTVDA